jgi:hypothetical protein
MAETYEIKQYTYYVFSSRNASEGNAALLLYGDKGYLGAASFSNDPATPLKPAQKSASGFISLYYRMSDLSVIVDMLRNEKPVNLIYDGSQNSRIATVSEPVGEGEVPGSV